MPFDLLKKIKRIPTKIRWFIQDHWIVFGTIGLLFICLVAYVVAYALGFNE